jgi:hypothetical protein
MPARYRSMAIQKGTEPVTALLTNPSTSGYAGQVSNPEQNAMVKGLAACSQHLLAAASKAATGIVTECFFVVLTHHVGSFL